LSSYIKYLFYNLLYSFTIINTFLAHIAKQHLKLKKELEKINNCLANLAALAVKQV